MDLSLNVPINGVSFGQVSFNIFKEISGRNIDSLQLFPIGGIDVGSFNLDLVTKNKIESSLIFAQERHKRNTPTLKLWHISGLLDSISDRRVAITFHETSLLTKGEENILKQQDLIFVTSNYTKSVFESHGVKNVIYLPLGFDNLHFQKTGGHKLNSIVWGLNGKMEKRKSTLRVLKIWAKMFGNNKSHRLHCTINNPFISPQDQERLILSELGGNIPWNINFIPSQKLNSDYNKVLNSIDIDLTGMSCCEGFNLPAFQATCLGKWGIYLNAHAHKDFVNEKNAILVEPSGMQPAYDGLFFKNDGQFNCGEWFDFKDEDLTDAMLKAISFANLPNKEGEKLASEFTYKKTCDILLEYLK